MSAPMSRPLGTELQTRFARNLEAEYGQRAASYIAEGLDSEESHRRALEDAKQLGQEALEELGRRGLFPWSGAEGKREGDPDVR